MTWRSPPRWEHSPSHTEAPIDPDSSTLPDGQLLMPLPRERLLRGKRGQTTTVTRSTCKWTSRSFARKVFFFSFCVSDTPKPKRRFSHAQSRTGSLQNNSCRSAGALEPLSHAGSFTVFPKRPVNVWTSVRTELQLCVATILL